MTIDELVKEAFTNGIANGYGDTFKNADNSFKSPVEIAADMMSYDACLELAEGDEVIEAIKRYIETAEVE